jgi:probable selenium-dependent hydroxylase accessory protein YqeC
MNLVQALTPKMPARVAIVGGGGKTSALFQLARQLNGQSWVSTTTHLGTDQLGFADKHFIVNRVMDVEVEQWLSQKVTLLTGEFTPDDRVEGPGDELLQQLYRLAEDHRVSILVEADGSRSRPIKAPGINEPATPAWAEMVITVVGLSALGLPFTEATVHRVDPFIRITGLPVGQPITIENIRDLLASPLGGLKNSPANAVKAALLNQADTPEICEQAKKIAPELIRAGYDYVLVGSLKYASNDLWCFQKEK